MQNTYMPTKLLHRTTLRSKFKTIGEESSKTERKCIRLMCVLTKLQAEVRMSLQETNIGKEHSVADLRQNANGQHYTEKCSV